MHGITNGSARALCDIAVSAICATLLTLALITATTRMYVKTGNPLGKHPWAEAAYNPAHVGIFSTMRGLCYFVLGAPILEVAFIGLSVITTHLTTLMSSTTTLSAFAMLPTTTTCEWPIALLLDDLVPVVMAVIFMLLAQLHTHYICLRTMPAISF